MMVQVVVWEGDVLCCFVARWDSIIYYLQTKEQNRTEKKRTEMQEKHERDD
jgi:hypothetical protein